MQRMRRTFSRFGLAVLVLGLAAQVEAAKFEVTVDTDMWNGTAAVLAFDLIDGNGVNDSSVAISALTGGTLGAYTVTGGAAGTPFGVTLEDTSAFNEYLREITLGASLSFVFDATGPASSPPDGFSFLILDSTDQLPLFPTDAPGGSGALLLYSFGADPSSNLEVFRFVPQIGDPSDIVTATPVPEPGVLTLALAGLAALGCFPGLRRGAARPVAAA